MALYVMIRKVREAEDAVEYAFGPDESRVGRLRLDKSNGQVSLLEPAPGDEREALYLRAASKVVTHWTAGELPDVTCWAS